MVNSTFAGDEFRFVLKQTALRFNNFVVCLHNQFVVIVSVSFTTPRVIFTLCMFTGTQVVPQRHHRPAGRGHSEGTRHSWQLFGSTQQEECRRFLPVCQVKIQSRDFPCFKGLVFFNLFLSLLDFKFSPSFPTYFNLL